jgi:DNA-binding transcriptional MocR family regulator
MIFQKGTFSIFPSAMCKSLHPYQQVIMAWLCKHANNDGYCFPSLATLAEECGMSKRSIIRHLEELEKMQYIKKNQRHTNEGDNTSNMYQVVLQSKVVSNSHQGGDTESPGVVTEVHTNYNHTELKPINQNKNIMSGKPDDVFIFEGIEIKKPGFAEKDHAEDAWMAELEVYRQLHILLCLLSIHCLT